jgi:hypothetical protein
MTILWEFAEKHPKQVGAYGTTFLDPFESQPSLREGALKRNSHAHIKAPCGEQGDVRPKLAAFRAESPRKWLTANWYLNGNRFQLRQVIQIMACDGFNELAEGHLSTLRMQ